VTRTVDNDHQADDVAARAHRAERRRILAEQCQRLLDRWAAEDAVDEVVASAPTVAASWEDCP
jgi:hypothetical protein